MSMVIKKLSCVVTQNEENFVIVPILWTPRYIKNRKTCASDKKTKPVQRLFITSKPFGQGLFGT